MTAIQATWLAGATAFVLPLPLRLGSRLEFVAQTRERIDQADTAVVLTDASLAELVDGQDREPGPTTMPPTALIPDLAVGDPAQWRRPTDDPSRLDILQFTSGSTADPKGVMVPDSALCANLDAITAAARLKPMREVMVSWLPLYHDMGLIGLLTLSMSLGCPLVLAAPQDFIAQPSRWMQWVSDYRGTFTAGPNFSYALSAKALQVNSQQLDLSCLTFAVNAAEPVDPTTVEAFTTAGRRHKLNPGAVFCAFGMAEVSVAGTFPEPGSGLRTDCVDRHLIETQRVARQLPGNSPDAQQFVRLGKPVPGLQMRIVHPETGRVLSERNIGELEISGTSVTPGYYRRPDTDAATFRDGWLRSGDLAYIVDGELVVCGRLKDVVIVGGRKILPVDVERAAENVDGVRRGNVIAFGATGIWRRETLVVVAETRLTAQESLDALTGGITDRVVDTVGVPVSNVVLLAPGTLPKTSSGKLQRGLCRRRYEAGELRPTREK